MHKTDESLRKICIASIKRYTFKPFDYPLTTIFETQTASEIGDIVPIASIDQQNELPIALTYVDRYNWTLLTTKTILSTIKGELNKIEVSKVIERTWGDFKGYEKLPTTLGVLTLNDDTTFQVLIETGKASMILIYGIMTLVKQETSVDAINKTLNRYQKRGLFDQQD
jgi:hypothetical protein